MSNTTEESVYGIRRAKLKSSLLAECCYDGSLSVLDVTYVDGKSYRFYDVPESVWLKLEKNGSHGRYFLDEIRERFKRSRIPSLSVD